MDREKGDSERKRGGSEKKFQQALCAHFIWAHMHYNRSDIVKLLEKIEEATKIDLTHASCEAVQERLSEMYSEVTKGRKKHLPLFDKYLYRKLQLPCDRNEEIIKASAATLNAVAQALGFESFSHFVRITDAENDPALRNSVGEWYSYVRCNSGQPYVLRAPVKIYEERKEIYMELKGPVRTFKGQVRMRGECLHCLLESDRVKKIYLLLKTGFSVKPTVLQGIFSGVSTAGDPIAGREVLVRADAPYDELTPLRIAIDELLASGNKEREIIGNYFLEKNDNILKAGASSTFGWDDLKQ